MSTKIEEFESQISSYFSQIRHLQSLIFDKKREIFAERKQLALKDSTNYKQCGECEEYFDKEDVTEEESGMICSECCRIKYYWRH